MIMMLGISEQILQKPSKLTAEEYEQIKTHASLGAQLLEMSRGLRHVAPFVRRHHRESRAACRKDAIMAPSISM
jgi:HD-GYP domain-containing protein (c-di-GMP phosphodiesterase class II)